MLTLKSVSAEFIEMPENSSTYSYNLKFNFQDETGQPSQYTEVKRHDPSTKVDLLTEEKQNSEFPNKFFEVGRFLLDFKNGELHQTLVGDSKGIHIEIRLVEGSVMSNQLFGQELLLPASINIPAKIPDDDPLMATSIASNITGYFSARDTVIPIAKTELSAVGRLPGYPTALRVSLRVLGSYVADFLQQIQVLGKKKDGLNPNGFSCTMVVAGETVHLEYKVIPETFVTVTPLD